MSIAVISLNFLCDDAFADPWIMPGAVDITDATEIEDYIPEVETIAYYDEYGMPRNENGDIIGSMWCYDPETELYCIYSNEGELTTQKEYPYDISDMELGELDIRLSYRKNYAINPEGMEAVLYLLNSDRYLYAVRIPTTVDEYVVTLPIGEYTPYMVQSYDYDKVIVDCPSLPTECQILKEDAGHLNLIFELTYVEPPLTEEDLTDISLQTAVRSLDYRFECNRVAGILIQPDVECSGASECEGNGFLYEKLRNYYEADREIQVGSWEGDEYHYSGAQIGSVHYSLKTVHDENIYTLQVYENKTVLLEEQVETEKRPEARCLIYDTDLYFSWTDSFQNWHTKRYSFVDGSIIPEEQIAYYDSFSPVCRTYRGTDGNYYIEASDRSWCQAVSQNVVDAVAIEDTVFLLCEENENRKLYRYDASVGNMEEQSDFEITKESEIAFNNTWLYWTTQNENTTTVFREEVVTKKREKVCSITGSEVSKISAEKDYLIFLSEMPENQEIIFQSGDYFLQTKECVFALDLETKEVLRVQMNNPLVDTYLGRLPWGDDELFEKVSSYIDQFVITPNIIKGITGQKLDVETSFNKDAMLKNEWVDKKNTIWTDYLGIYARGMDYVVIDLATGIGKYWYEDSDGKHLQGTLDYLNLTGTGEESAQTFFEDHKGNYGGSMFGDKWFADGRPMDDELLQKLIGMMEEKNSYGIILLRRKKLGRFIDISVASYAGTTPKGRPFFYLLDYSGRIAGSMVFDNIYNYYVVFGESGYWSYDGYVPEW